MKSKGNIKRQKKKRRQRLKNSVRLEHSYEAIDGNLTFYPVAYCKYHKGVLTEGLIETHRCVHRHCKGFVKEGVVFE